MLPDFHIHTSFSQDSSTPARMQIERCLALGMEEICITDHHDYDAGLVEPFLLDFPVYLSELSLLREEYSGRIRVNIGVELGLQIRIREYLNRLVDSLDVDYIIGSSHSIDQMDPFYPSFFEGRSEREAYGPWTALTLSDIWITLSATALTRTGIILMPLTGTTSIPSSGR